MGTIRRFGFFRSFFWLVILACHLNLAFAYFGYFNENDKKQNSAVDCVFVSASSISLLAEKPNSEKNLSSQLLCFLITATVCFNQRISPSFKHFSRIYTRVVKAYNSSPTYIINRVLLL